MNSLTVTRRALGAAATAALPHLAARSACPPRAQDPAPASRRRPDRRTEVARPPRGDRRQRFPHPDERLRRARAATPMARSRSSRHSPRVGRSVRTAPNTPSPSARGHVPRRRGARRRGGEVQLRPDAERGSPLPRHRAVPAVVFSFSAIEGDRGDRPADGGSSPLQRTPNAPFLSNLAYRTGLIGVAGSP